MAKQFYTGEETQSKLGMSEEEIKQLVRDGQLREFRDAGQVRYKVDEVDGLADNLGTLSGSLSGTSGELVLEPSDETSMGLTGSDMLTLEEADTTADGTAIEDKQGDTVITSVGISVFDDEEVSEVDPGAKTVVADESRPGASSSNIAVEDSGSTGSGLLDLSRESDDTSLGAELLDEIYTEDAEAGMPEMGDATRAGLEAGVPEEPAPEESLEKTETLSESDAIEPVVPVVVQRGPSNAVETGLSGALFGAVLTLVVAGITASANVQGVLPGLLEQMSQKLPMFAGILAGIPLLCFVVGFFMGRRGARSTSAGPPRRPGSLLASPEQPAMALHEVHRRVPVGV